MHEDFHRLRGQFKICRYTSELLRSCVLLRNIRKMILYIMSVYAAVLSASPYHTWRSFGPGCLQLNLRKIKLTLLAEECTITCISLSVRKSPVQPRPLSLSLQIYNNLPFWARHNYRHVALVVFRVLPLTAIG